MPPREGEGEEGVVSGIQGEADGERWWGNHHSHLFLAGSPSHAWVEEKNTEGRCQELSRTPRADMDSWNQIFGSQKLRASYPVVLKVYSLDQQDGHDLETG